MRRLAILLLAAPLLAACGPTTRTASLTVQLRFPMVSQTAKSDRPSAPCSGALEYEEVRSGAPVVFRDDTGTVVGTATLMLDEGRTLMDCHWHASTKIESEGKFFTAEVGGWQSPPLKAGSGSLEFELMGWRPKDGGREVQVDPRWHKETR